MQLREAIAASNFAEAAALKGRLEALRAGSGNTASASEVATRAARAEAEAEARRIEGLEQTKRQAEQHAAKQEAEVKRKEAHEAATRADADRMALQAKADAEAALEAKAKAQRAQAQAQAQAAKAQAQAQAQALAAKASQVEPEPMKATVPESLCAPASSPSEEENGINKLILEGLKRTYRERLRPLEQLTKFDMMWASPPPHLPTCRFRCSSQLTTLGGHTCS